LSDFHEKYLELMHAEMDGEISDEELVALREYLAFNPEARRVHAELAKLTGILNQVEQVEAPDDLRGNILAALPPRRPVLGTVRPMSPWRLRIPTIRYGYALAAGLLLGVLLTGLGLKNVSTVEKSDFYGTMTARKDNLPYVVVDQIKLNAPDLEGSVGLSRSASGTMIVFDLTGSQQVEVEVGFDGSQAGLRGFSQQPGAIRSFEAREGIISFQSQGKQRSTVILSRDKDAPLLLNLSFYVGGKLVNKGTLGGAVSVGTPK
jgi:hypothetical protein